MSIAILNPVRVLQYNTYIAQTMSKPIYYSETWLLKIYLYILIIFSLQIEST